MKFLAICTVLLLTAGQEVASFAPRFAHKSVVSGQSALSLSSDEWTGDVVTNLGGVIQGCAVTPIGEEPHTEWVLQIDGVDADLGKFSAAIYNKMIGDAKRQRFQGFRPGTIPPHLEPTYRAYTMDECARETVMEAMQQNSIRPFSDARMDLTIHEVCIPPPVKKKTKKKSKTRKSKQAAAAEPEEEPAVVVDEEKEPEWLTCENMKEAIDAGWRPGQSFSFVARNVKGQKVLAAKDTEGARPLGMDY